VSALGPEAAPVAIGAGEALAALGALAAFLFARGMIQMVDAVVRVLFGATERVAGFIPFGGRIVRAPIHKLEQRLTNVLGSAINTLDRYIAHSWHVAAHLIRRLGGQIVDLAETLYMLAAITQFLVPYVVFRRTLAALLHPLRTAQQIERALRRAETTTVTIVKTQVVHGVLPRVGSIEAELDHVIEIDIPALRARVKELERRATHSWEWLRKHQRSLAAVAFSGAVAMALRRLGLGWLRCRNVRKVGKAVCGLPASLLDDLLALSFAFGVLIDPEDVAKLAVEAVDELEGLLRRMLGETVELEREAQSALAGLLG
jgi:hypothetical protein